MTTVRLTLNRAAYRILFAMGGVRVLAVERAGDQTVRATLELTDSMLAYARGMEGVTAVEVVDAQIGDDASA